MFSLSQIEEKKANEVLATISDMTVQSAANVLRHVKGLVDSAGIDRLQKIKTTMNLSEFISQKDRIQKSL